MENSVEFGNMPPAKELPDWLKNVTADIDTGEDHLSYADFRFGSLVAVSLLAAFAIIVRFI